MTTSRRIRGLLIVIGTVVALIAIGCGGELDGEAPSEGAPQPPVADSGGEPRSADIDGAGNVDAAGGAPSEGPAGAPAGGDAPIPDPKLQGLVDRKIIQSTSVDVEVEEVGRNFQEVIRLAETFGGHVVSSSFSQVDDEQVADLTIRVPHDRYQEALNKIRLMGEVVNEKSDGNDVTEEYTDLQARLRTLEATERRYLELLAQANGIEEILLVQDRLDVVRGQIEQVQGRINLLDGLTELSTITIHLRPLAAGAEPGGGGPHPLEAGAKAWEYSLQALRGLAAAGLAVAAFSWWLLPPLAALGIGVRWWLSRRPRAVAETSM